MLPSAVSAVCTAAAVALNGMEPVLWPPKLSAKPPPVGVPVTDRVCTAAPTAPVVVWASPTVGLPAPVSVLPAAEMTGWAPTESGPGEGDRDVGARQSAARADDAAGADIGQAASAVSSCAAVALKGTGAVVWPSNASWKVPAVGAPLTEMVWMSLTSAPAVVCTIEGVGLAPPVRPFVPIVISACARNASGPAKKICTAVPGSGPPAQVTPPAPMVGVACSAVCTCAAVALNPIAALVCPPKLKVNEPPVGPPLTLSVCRALASAETFSTGTTLA